MDEIWWNHEKNLHIWWFKMIKPPIRWLWEYTKLVLIMIRIFKSPRIQKSLILSAHSKGQWRSSARWVVHLAGRTWPIGKSWGNPWQNQTYPLSNMAGWKIHDLWMIFPLKPPFIGDVPCHLKLSRPYFHDTVILDSSRFKIQVSRKNALCCPWNAHVVDLCLHLLGSSHQKSPNFGPNINMFNQ